MYNLNGANFYFRQTVNIGLAETQISVSHTN